MEAQIGLGADVMMAFDECTEYPAEPKRVRDSMEMTLRWAERSKKYFEAHKDEVPWSSNVYVGASALTRPDERSSAVADSEICSPARTGASGPTCTGKTQALFGIVQGGMDLALRKESAERTIELGFDGYAIGGLSVGEPRALTREVVEATAAKQCQLAVLVPPARMQHVEQIAGHLEKMPPKSTYFYPKLLSGLVFNPLKGN